MTVRAATGRLKKPFVSSYFLPRFLFLFIVYFIFLFIVATGFDRLQSFFRFFAFFSSFFISSVLSALLEEAKEDCVRFRNCGQEVRNDG